jgi:hypothetical protein
MSQTPEQIQAELQTLINLRPELPRPVPPAESEAYKEWAKAFRTYTQRKAELEAALVLNGIEPPTTYIPGPNGYRRTRSQS